MYGQGAEFRTMAACMEAIYLGTADNASGEIAFVEDFPAELLWGGDDTKTVSGPNVDMLFSGSTRVKRLGTRRHENVWRPTADGTFMSGSDGYAMTPTTHPAPSGRAASIKPIAMGFAWRGVAAPTNISFKFTKALEWKPQLGVYSGHKVGTTNTGPNIVNSVLSVLDARVPDWTANSRKAVNNIAKAASNTYSLYHTMSDAGVFGLVGQAYTALRGT
jgi:hypothetical protein